MQKEPHRTESLMVVCLCEKKRAWQLLSSLISLLNQLTTKGGWWVSLSFSHPCQIQNSVLVCYRFLEHSQLLATFRDDGVGSCEPGENHPFIVLLCWFLLAFREVSTLQNRLVFLKEVWLNRWSVISFSFLNFRSAISSGCGGCTLFDLSLSCSSSFDVFPAFSDLHFLFDLLLIGQTSYYCFQVYSWKTVLERTVPVG